MQFCDKMCPESEMIFREKNGLLHHLEMIDLDRFESYRSSQSFKKDRNIARDRECTKKTLTFTNDSIAVKQYVRSSAGRQMNETKLIRSTKTLRKTIDYLLGDCWDRKALNLRYKVNQIEIFSLYYDFVFDRLRAIRQDLCILQSHDPDCFYIIEKCIEFYLNFHFIFHQKLRIDEQIDFEKTFAKSRSNFDSHINQTHLQDCLSLLIDYYDYFQNDCWSLNRHRFESIYILYNLRENLQHLAFERIRALRSKPDTNRMLNERMRTIFDYLRCYLIGNHFRCLRIILRSDQDRLLRILFLSFNAHSHHLELIRLINIAYRSAIGNKLSLRELIEWFCPQRIDRKESQIYSERLFRNHGFKMMQSDRDDLETSSIIVDKSLPIDLRYKWTEMDQILLNHCYRELILDKYRALIQ